MPIDDDGFVEAHLVDACRVHQSKLSHPSLRPPVRTANAASLCSDGGSLPALSYEIGGGGLDGGVDGGIGCTSESESDWQLHMLGSSKSFGSSWLSGMTLLQTKLVVWNDSATN